MSATETISQALDAINNAIFFNYGFLPLMSAVIYIVWTKSVHKPTKSAWYISLGIPGAVALIPIVISSIFLFPNGNPPLGEKILFLLETLICGPGYTVPTVVLAYHVFKFSPTNPMTRSAYLFAIPIVLTYMVNAFIARYLADW